MVGVQSGGGQPSGSVDTWFVVMSTTTTFRAFAAYTLEVARFTATPKVFCPTSTEPTTAFVLVSMTVRSLDEALPMYASDAPEAGPSTSHFWPVSQRM